MQSAFSGVEAGVSLPIDSCATRDKYLLLVVECYCSAVRRGMCTGPPLAVMKPAAPLPLLAGGEGWTVLT
jgi:hypothetical protein